MDAPNNNVGQYRFGVSHEQPPKDIERRRVEAMRSWLLKQFKKREASDNQTEG